MSVPASEGAIGAPSGMDGVWWEGGAEAFVSAKGLVVAEAARESARTSGAGGWALALALSGEPVASQRPLPATMASRAPRSSHQRSALVACFIVTSQPAILQAVGVWAVKPYRVWP